VGFFCSVHCKLEQLNYSSLVAVIKYGDGPRDAESAELVGLLRLRHGSSGKGGLEMGPDPAAAGGGQPGLLHCINARSHRWSRGSMPCLFSACVFAFPGALPGAVTGAIPSWVVPRAGSSCTDYPQVGKTGFRAMRLQQH